MPKQTKQTITLRNVKGEEEAQVTATIVGSYGVHKHQGYTRRYPYWTVTHVASGLIMRVCNSKDQAFELAQKLVDQLGDTSKAISWEREGDKVVFVRDQEFIRKSYEIVGEYL